MHYTLKLLDVLFQALVFVAALTMLVVFELSGYFYWAIVVLCCWAIPSSLLHLFIKQSISIGRWFFLGGFLLVAVSLFIYYLNGATVGLLNFYFYPLGVVLVITQIFLALYELSRMRKGSEQFTDF